MKEGGLGKEIFSKRGRTEDYQKVEGKEIRKGRWMSNRVKSFGEVKRNEKRGVVTGFGN